jgi:putative MFS transporter
MNMADTSPGAVVARLDRIPIWSLPYLFAGIIGLGFLFTFFDIFDINVSFIQTCLQIVPHCTPESAGQTLGFPVLINLIGYVVGTLILSPLADRIGRRDMLLVTMAITGIGSLLTAFTGDLTTFTIARFITGIGVGADLAVVNTYINEVAPRAGRAKYTALVFIMSSLGAFLGIWLGLVLTTQATPFPLGLPFAVAGPGFGAGWRIMYGIGALLALIGIVLRFQLPESPRWLVTRGRTTEAERVVTYMEERAQRTGGLPEPEPTIGTVEAASRLAYADIFGSGTYLRRMLLLLAVWFTGYATVYAYGAGFTVVLAALRYPPPEAGLIVAVGVFGFILCALIAFFWGERLERKLWLPISTALTIIGAILVALAGQQLAISFLGAIIVFVGFNLWVPMTYSWSTENFPTRARTTGFALVDGIGHIGGGVGLLIVAPLIPGLGPLFTMLAVTAGMVVAAILAQFGIRTRNLRLDAISP